jgi:hypothetical protein
MDAQIATENQRDQIRTYHIHPTERYLSTGIHQTIIPQTDTVKYLGLHIDKRLTWREHVTKIRKHLDLKTRELIWLIGKHSPLSLTNKLLIYKIVLKPIWTYGLALWVCGVLSRRLREDFFMAAGVGKENLL